MLVHQRVDDVSHIIWRCPTFLASSWGLLSIEMDWGRPQDSVTYQTCPHGMHSKTTKIHNINPTKEGNLLFYRVEGCWTINYIHSWCWFVFTRMNGGHVWAKCSTVYHTWTGLSENMMLPNHIDIPMLPLQTAKTGGQSCIYGQQQTDFNRKWWTLLPEDTCGFWSSSSCNISHRCPSSKKRNKPRQGLCKWSDIFCVFTREFKWFKSNMFYLNDLGS